MKKCTGCGRIDNEPIGLNSFGVEYLGCCPDNDYVDLTLSELRLELKETNKKLDKLLLLGSNDESIVDVKREIQKLIKDLKNKK